MYKFKRYRQIGLSGYQTVPLFEPSLLVEFCRHLTADILSKIKEIIIDYNIPDDQPTDGGNLTELEAEIEGENTGTFILDATCAPQNISFPQDISILNESRENLENIIDYVCDRLYYYKRRIYRNNARKDYLNLVKCKKAVQQRSVQRSRGSYNTSGETGNA